MDTETPMLLDHEGDALAPKGYAVIETEQEFLRQALDGAPLLVRKDALCRWAKVFWQGRGFAVEEKCSPLRDLLSACPNITREQAQRLTEVLGEDVLRRPQSLHPFAVLEALYPNGPWNGQPGRIHGAEWLLWLDQTKLPEYVTPLLALKAESWRQNTENPERAIYEVQTALEATSFLESWLRITDGQRTMELGAFPISIPVKWVKRAREKWMIEIVSAGGHLFEAIRKLPMPYALREVAAEVTFKYFQRHQDLLMSETVKAIAPFLSEQDAAALSNLCPPSDPGNLPETVESVLYWFEHLYLPFRKWETEFGGDAAHERVAQLAGDFARWCLVTYPSALHGGAGNERLAISYARSLRETRKHYVTFWVILDGLPYSDVQSLTTLIENEPRLALEKCAPVISLLPTVTEFCKPALMNGMPHRVIEDPDPKPTFEGARQLKRNLNPQDELREAQPGDVFVWSLLEPDETYHSMHKHSDRSTIRTEVAGQIKTIAQKIVQASLAVPHEFTLRLVISTDHGRLLTSGERKHPFPSGMKPHGRAAWGVADEQPMSGGYKIDEEKSLVYLNKERFELPVDCAVVWGGEVYLTGSGSHGKEEFPHGGLYPEEVLVPWIEFSRDRATPLMRCILRGKARAGARGELKINIENPSDIPVTIVEAQIVLSSQDTRTLNLNMTINPMSASNFEYALDRWPTNAHITRARGAAVYKLPNGTLFDGDLTFDLESEEMYRSDFSLEDL